MMRQKTTVNVVEWVENVSFDAAILANGDFPTHCIPLRVLRHAPYVVVCDGAVNSYPMADAVVGDGDSIAPEHRSKLKLVNEQDDNDLTKATRYCMEHLDPPVGETDPALVKDHLPLKIAYLGAMGGREDHMLGNIALLMRYYRDFGLDVRMLTDYGMFTPAHGDSTFSCRVGQQVSIFNFGSTRITSEQLKWPAYAYQELWQGSLNEAQTDHFTLHADGYYMVYQTYGHK